MSQQNTPDNDPKPSPYGQGPAGQEPSSNPYYGNAQAQAAPDLDASAPQLRSAEEQRLNRKALLFLGGILLLLVAMGFLLFRGSQEEDESATKQREVARASTPELPKIDAAQSTVPPPVEPLPPIPMLPDPPRSSPELVPISSRPEQMQPRGPTLLERRISGADDAAVGAGNRPGMPGQRSAIDEQTRQALLANMMPNQQGPQKERRGPDVEDVSSASFIQSPDALLVRGTYLRCVLETRIITDLSGYTSCLLTEPVYSINGRSLLLPKGSKIYGAYAGGPKGKRVEVIWDRVTTPNGIDVAMSSPGVDQLGGAGHPGQYSAHWGSRIASALMVSLIADAFKYAAAEHGPESTTVSSSGFAVQSPYESATARTMERLANDALNSTNRPPTVTINQGTIVNVYVAKDVDFTNVLNPRR
ncbi:TrbI/VirB10 family protein [Stenotrophomonas sp. C1657]|uniref:TrbI/VirB10 family protein n=1 Tax=Stenotrophomonas sp. C1657 TaxID=3077844 RepID=UPI00293D0708|nr:TrbI/VirB10 family protein [Stenotrophomonas sp. C1657]MDV3514646.1 TrbI/VirB10 family protein [Stenotrophomonas sp. C1657]